jgi:methyl-accepting chemotaxis protein
MMFAFKSIQSRILFWAGICILLVAGILIAYSSINVRSTSKKAAEEQALFLAREKASSIRSELELALHTADTLSMMFVTSKNSKISLLGRGQAIELLRGILEGNPNFLGTYTGWEPNAFDGRDSANVNLDGHDATGRFVPYLVRSNGKIILTPLLDYEKEGIGDYYLLPKQTKQPQVIEPYIYPIDGEDVFLTSFIVPVVVDDQFLGMTGVDFRLDFLQSLADKEVIFDGQGEMLLVSNTGILAAITGKQELIGKMLIDVEKGWEEYLPGIKEGKENTETKNGSLVIMTPIQIGSTNSPWSVIIKVPEAVVTQAATRMMTQMILIGIILAVIALVFLWMAARQISRPVIKITAVANAISRGDLSSNVEIDQQDEIGQLANAFRQLNQSLTEKALLAEAIAQGDLTQEVQLISDQDRLGRAFQQMTLTLREQVGQVAISAMGLRNAAGQLAATSIQAGQATGQIASTVQDVTRGVSQQTVSITQTAGSIEMMTRAIDAVAAGAREQASSTSGASEITNQLASAIQQVTQNVQEVTKNSLSAADNARSGGHTVEETIASMQGIRSTVQASEAKVQEMGQRSAQISTILETIEDIASQTNLLALNAAIEAARAGEHGKGFAVVADEVRKLAERSAFAAREIGALVHRIQTTVAEAVSSMSQSAGEVEKGVCAANQAGNALADILRAAEAVSRQAELATQAAARMENLSSELVAATEMVSAIVEENTASTSEMTAGSNEVMRLVENIASISEENSASMEEVSASTEEMTAQVEEVSASAQVLAAMAGELSQVVEKFQL